MINQSASNIDTSVVSTVVLVLEWFHMSPISKKKSPRKIPPHMEIVLRYRKKWLNIELHIIFLRGQTVHIHFGDDPLHLTRWVSLKRGYQIFKFQWIKNWIIIMDSPWKYMKITISRSTKWYPRFFQRSPHDLEPILSAFACARSRAKASSWWGSLQ